MEWMNDTKVKELQENFYKMSYANQIIEDIGLKLN